MLSPKPGGRGIICSMTDETRRALRALQVIAVLAAFLWSLGLFVMATTVPVYETSGSGSNGSSETLVGENGTWVLMLLAVPLTVAALVALALLVRRRWALWIACAATAALALGNVAAMLTIGIFVLPVTAALIVGCIVGGVCEFSGRLQNDQNAWPYA